jgi:hypothetical protein
MESTKNSVDVVHPSQLLRIAHDIHNACMAISAVLQVALVAPAIRIVVFTR